MQLKQFRAVALSLFISALWIYKSSFSKLNSFTTENPPGGCYAPSTLAGSKRVITANAVVDSEEYRFIQNLILSPTYKLCAAKPFIIMIVTSDVGHFELRRSLRSVMPQNLLKSMDIARVFLLGKIPLAETRTTQDRIEVENEIYEDILQGSFTENYRNLTYKHLMGLQWASKVCNDASYILKVDDDAVFNIKKIFRFLSPKKLKGDFLLGYMQNNTKPQRNKENKWYVSRTEYSKDYYPSYLSGWYYVTTPATAARLTNEATHYQYLWIDDILITGLLPEALCIKLIQLDDEFWFEYTNNCIIQIRKLGWSI